jgi:oligosaccharide repeat unit polymerase
MIEVVLKYGYLYVLFSIIILLFFRKYLTSIFDPIIFILLAISSSLAISCENYFFVYVLISSLAFFLSFYFVGNPLPSKKIIVYENNDLNLLLIFTYIYFFLYIIINLYLFWTSGIPLFTKNPTLNKVIMYNDGLGFIRRINFSSNFLTICIFLSFILSKEKKIFFIMLLINVIITVISGSKSGLLYIIFIVWYIIQNDFLWTSTNLYLRKMIKSTIKYLFITSIIIFIAISIIESKNEDSSPFFSILFRLMEFGDVMIYYSVDYVRDYFSHLGIIDYFRYELNGIFGMLRLDNYLEPIGYQLVKAYWNKDNLFNGAILGPNALFFVKGHIFFGYIGGVIYSFLIGFTVAFARKKILNSQIKNIFIFALSTYLFFTLPVFLKEFSLAFSMCVDLIIFFSPIFLISLLINERFNYLQKIEKNNE